MGISTQSSREGCSECLLKEWISQRKLWGKKTHGYIKQYIKVWKLLMYAYLVCKEDNCQIYK